MGYYNDLTLGYTAEDARYDRIDYGMSYCGNSTTGADQGMDIDPDANDGSGNTLVDEAYALTRVLWSILKSATYPPEIALLQRLHEKASHRYWRRLALLQPAPRAEYEFTDADDLPF